MKKIIILVLLIFSIIVLSGCYTEQDKQMFKEQLAIPSNDNYIIIGERLVTANNQNYDYKSIIEKKLKQDNKKIDDSFHILSIKNTVYKNKIYLTALYNESALEKKREYIIGYLDVLTLKYNFIGYRETIDDELRTFIVGEYFYILHKEYMEEYSVITDQKEVESHFGNSKVFYNKYGIVFYDSNNTTIIDYKNQQRNLSIACNSVEDLYVNFIVYQNDKSQTVVFNYITKEQITYQEYYELTRKDYDYEKYMVDRDDNNLSFTYNDNQINLSINELRESNEIIQEIESIFNTSISFKKILFINNEIYITISNDSNFFGGYAKGATYPSVFRYNLDDSSLEYIGCYGDIGGENNFTVYKK